MFDKSAMLALAVLLAAPLPAVAQTKPEGEAMVWPLPPDAPRIRYEGWLQSARDVGQKESFFSRMKNGILGEQQWIEGVSRPWDVYVDPAGVIYISNASAQGLYVIDPNEKEARVLRGEGRAAVSKAMGLAGTRDGLIFIADAGGRRVVAMNAAGEFVSSYGGRDQLLNPVDVALSPDESKVYVVDSYMHQVLVYDRSGELIGRIGKDEGGLAEKADRRNEALTHTLQAEPQDPQEAQEAQSEPSDLFENRGSGAGEFRYPAFVATSPDGTVYVSDAMNFRVQAFHADETFSHEFGGLGYAAGRFARVKGIGVDAHGNVYVADASFNNVQIFNSSGLLLMAFAQIGAGPGQLWMPAGVTVDAANRVLVSDRYNNRIQVFQYLHVEEVATGNATGSNPPKGSHKP